MPTLVRPVPLATAAVPAVLPPALAVLFWLWLAVALVIWILRLVRRFRRPKSPSPTPTPTPAADSGVPDHRQHRPEGRQNEEGLQPAAPAAEVGAPAAPSAPAPEPASGAPPASAAEDAAGRQGFFAPTAAAGGVGTGDGGLLPDAPRPTVVEAVQGIEMPCGLSPVVDGSVSIPNPFRVAFLTADAGAAEVGAALGDELQRLGFALTTPAATELLARKPGVELRVVLYPTAAAARRGLDAIFPAAPEGSVGVELST